MLEWVCVCVTRSGNINTNRGNKSAFTVEMTSDTAGMSDAEPQEFVAMQLVILRDFLNMLYGPVTALLRPSSVQRVTSHRTTPPKIADPFYYMYRVTFFPLHVR